MKIKYIFKLSLIASALSLTACGGSDSKPTPTPPDNIAPSVSFNPNASSVIEKATVNIAAVATDPDGTIASYQWKVTSNHTLALSGADSTSVSFIAPDVDLSGDTVQLEVTVTDDDGAKTVANTTIAIEPSTINLAIQGLATDSPLSAAKITVRVAGRDITVDTTAGSDGTYSVDLLLDDSEASSFISVIAHGVGEQSNAGLISLLGTVEELSALAGDDEVLTSAESFSVNVTNITTAKYALAKLANGGAAITNSALLESLFTDLNYDEVMVLATAIKVAIDKSANNDALALPAGVTDTLSLVENTAEANSYVQLVQSTPEFAEAQQEIYQDASLIDTQSNFVVPPKYYLLPPHTLAAGAIMNFMPDGKGDFEEFQFDWVESNGEITATITSPGASTGFTKLLVNGQMTTVRVESSVDKYQIKRISTSLKNDVLLITQTFRQHFPDGEFADKIETDTYTRTGVKEAGVLPIEQAGAGLAVVSIPKEMNEDSNVSTAIKSETLTLSANGQGMTERSNEAFTWKVEQGALQLTLDEGEIVRLKKLSTPGVLDVFAFEYSEDGIKFLAGGIVGQGKIITSKPAWDVAAIPGVYSYGSGTFSEPLKHFWLELQTNGDAETYSSNDNNSDGQLTIDELTIEYGKWKLETDGSLSITRAQGVNGNEVNSPTCRDAVTTDCILYHARTWTLLAKEDNQYGLLHEHRFYWSNVYPGSNSKDSVSFDNRTIFKMDTRPIDIDALQPN